MAVNKVNYAGTTLIDLTADTVTEDKLLKGVTAHNAAGAKITGTYTAPTTTVDTMEGNYCWQFLNLSTQKVVKYAVSNKSNAYPKNQMVDGLYSQYIGGV